MTSAHSNKKSLLDPMRSAMADFSAGMVAQALDSLLADTVEIHMCAPFGDLDNATALYQQVYAPLEDAIPDLERRDFIVMEGPDDAGDHWIGCAGHYVGTSVRPWLDIPPSGHFVYMRFHEFYRVRDNKVVEIQAVWDIPELIKQCTVWPLAPSLGKECWVPGPATCDGLTISNADPQQGERSTELVLDMLAHLAKHPTQGGAEVMELERFWHPLMSWYGPAGIGTCRGIKGFRNWHQIPFLKAMPDRGQSDDALTWHAFGEGEYVGLTGWPNMRQTVTADGWLGIAPSGQRIDIRSVDFWRIENGKIRENWVLIDFIDVYRQLGVDIFERVREFNKARSCGPISLFGDSM